MFFLFPVTTISSQEILWSSFYQRRHRKWLKEGKCYWLGFLSDEKNRKAGIRCEEPGPGWKLFDVRVLFQKDDYTAATLKLKEYLKDGTECLQSESEEESKRRRKENSRYDSDYEPIVVSKRTVSAKYPQNPPLPPVPSIPPLPNYGDSRKQGFLFRPSFRIGNGTGPIRCTGAVRTGRAVSRNLGAPSKMDMEPPLPPAQPTGTTAYSSHTV
ncbi:uncharacterized protein LOC121683580 [Alosa sapidissima]|uniref:uncharacterized protein LOC121683580 n=1 Tax=Alosa sapidissima TaxID=34773 RepID=UPI001C083DF1|nr:uncharacterized protein LOC121683580 [Alosa sapidissima]